MSSQRLNTSISYMRGFQRALRALSTAVIVILVSLSAQQTTAQPTFTTFDADIQGLFFVSGANGESPLFVVEESGTGYELMLGGFTYTTDLLHNMARAPDDCGPASSTDLGGFGIMTFAEGQLWLHRNSGSACFNFPVIELDEQWKIAGGTGAYKAATGKLVRTYVGNVLTGSGSGTFSGTIKLL